MRCFEKAKNIANLLLDCFFPRHCLLCGNEVDTDYSNLCHYCVNRIPFIRETRCKYCSRQIADVDDNSERICVNCKDREFYFNELRSCWAYKGIGRELVLKLKYYNADYVKNDISKLLKNKCQEICTFTSNSFLVPVPLHYFGFLVRGYNQAEVIANAIKCASSRSSVVKLLRGRYKRSQTKLKSSDRTKNVSDAFLCTSLCDNIDKNSKIILIDDVSTTGATSRECCKVLRNAGFTNLNVLTLSCRC